MLSSKVVSKERKRQMNGKSYRYSHFLFNSVKQKKSEEHNPSDEMKWLSLQFMYFEISFASEVHQHQRNHNYNILLHLQQ